MSNSVTVTNAVVQSDGPVLIVKWVRIVLKYFYKFIFVHVYYAYLNQKVVGREQQK